MRDDPVDEPDAFGLGRVDDLGEERELLGAVQADQPRQQPRAAEVERESALGEDLGEPGPLGRDDQIAAEREVAARAGRDAVDRRDVGCGSSCSRSAARPTKRIDASDAPRTAGPAVAPAADEIGARTERVARAGDHEHPVVAAFARPRRRSRSARATSRR